MTGRLLSRRALRAALRLAAIACLFALALGFGGSWARPLDTFAHFRAHLAVPSIGLCVFLLVQRQSLPASVLAAMAVIAIVSLAPFARFADPEEASGPAYTLLQMNLRWNSGETTEVLRRIAEADPDIVTLQEMTPNWRSALGPVEQRFPYQVHCPGADGFRGDSALLSRRPFVAGSTPVCDEKNSFAEARIDFNGIGVSVASHHQLWPWPAGQWERFDRLAETLRELPAPVLVAGDFNAVPWSAFVGAYAEALGARVVPGIGAVWAPPFVPDLVRRTAGLPLNNVLASPEITVLETRRLASTASDHLPVVIRFTVARDPAIEAPEISVASVR